MRSFLFILGLSFAACASPARAPTALPAPARAAKAPRDPVGGIDTSLRSAWAKAGLTPAPRADDATFLRRAWIDVVGTVPPPEVTTAFLADAAPGKRARAVEALLGSPAYAEHWMNYWDDVLMGREARTGNLVDRGAFRSWLLARFAENASWDRIVRELVSATGQNGNGGPKVKGAAMQITPVVDANEGEVNGAVNWTLRYEQNPQDLGGSASRIFLGVQIQCAQCHDHKTESWKQDDFRRFSNAFFHAKVEPIDRGKTMGARRVDLVDSVVAAPRFAKNPELSPIVHARPTALDGADLDQGKETRKALAAWMTAKENPWFARAFVNRMWGHFLGRGFFDPVDDMRPSNPATEPELLDAIAADFVAHDFDPRWLVRTICATEVYQLSASARAKTDAENKLWARFHLAPLGPEELLNALVRVTGLEATAERAGIKDVDALRASLARQYSFLFDVDEEDDEPDYSGTVSQALALLNGALVAQGTRALPGSVALDVANGPGTDEEKVNALALRVLSRPATPAERERWVQAIASGIPASTSAPPAPAGKGGKAGALDRLGRKKSGSRSERAAAYEDLIWALVNSSEFTFNH